MAEKAYKFLDKRSSQGYSNNHLIEASRPSADRKRVVMADRDFHRNISSYGRRVLASMGRRMFWNIPALMGMVLEQADLAVGTFIPQFYGANRAWGDLAETWLFNWHKIFDMAGWPYDGDAWLFNQVVSTMVDGDVGTILTETDQGYPMIQTIPGHRIGSGPQSSTDLIEGGPWDGAQIIDGVIVDDYMRPLAYRLLSEASLGYAQEYTDVPAQNMFLTFAPMFPGQLRGVSWLASSAFPWEDMAEWSDFERLAQKVFASKTIVETNEAGEVDTAKAVMATAATYDSSNNRTAPDVQLLQQGMYHYLKANSGSKLEAFDYSRPGAGSQNFMDRTVRDAFRGTEWDVFFSLEPGKVGGASMRVVVEKINRVLKKRRRMVGRAAARVDGYGVAKAIKIGDLAENVDWWKFERQGPGDVTADRKYDSDVDLQEIAQGISTRKKACGRRGDYFEEVDEQRFIEVDGDLTRAAVLAKKHGISIMEAMVCLRPPTPNQQLPPGPGDGGNGNGNLTKDNKGNEEEGKGQGS